jgi:hypothetical protein
MSVEPAESAYPIVLEDISRRISAAENAIDEVICNHGHQNNWISCEIIVLQIRKICELILLGSTLVHLNEGGDILNDNKWRPKDAFSELDKVNSHPLPLPVDVQIDKNGPGAHHAVPLSKPLPFAAISRIYGICGDLLHVPSARQVMKAKLPSYDVGQLQHWLSGLKRLMLGHALMLPEREKILLCIWSGVAGEKPSCFLLDASGPSTLNLSKFPDFDLFP